MLTIRKAQMEEFGRHRSAVFEQVAIDHVRKLFAEDCVARTEVQLRELIRNGIARGRSYGLTASKDLLTFIDHMFILGPEFDDKPEYSWARDVLTNTQFSSETKADLLIRLTMKHLGSDKRSFARRILVGPRQIPRPFVLWFEDRFA